MKRLLAVILVAAVAGAAAVLPEPDPAPEPLAGVVIDSPGIGTPSDSSIWYCPWAQASALRDSVVGVASVVEAEAALTFPVAIPGEPPDAAEVGMLGPGAANVVLSDVAQRGDSPAFIEFSDGPAAASVTVSGEVLTSDRCVSEGPDEWFFVGGSTNSGETLTLRLFNPFPETARVTIQGFSEIGVEALGDLRSLSVNPRSWRNVEFEEELRQRQDLVISVTVDEGLVIPAMAFSAGGDEAWWSGTPLATSWEIPVARSEVLSDSSIVVANPGASEAQVTVTFFTAEGDAGQPISVALAPESPLRIAVPADGLEVVGARVDSPSQIAVSVVASGEAGLGITAGLPEPARRWLLPGVQTVGRTRAEVWLLNVSDEVASVTVSELTGLEVLNTNVVVEGGSLMRLAVEGDALGYFIDAVSPITVMWSMDGPSGAALSGGVVVPDE